MSGKKSDNNRFRERLKQFRAFLEQIGRRSRARCRETLQHWRRQEYNLGLHHARLKILYRGEVVKLDYWVRTGTTGTLLYLHGLGCNKDDFVGATKIPALKGYTLVAFDFPGCGGSSYPTNLHLSVDDLRELTRLFVEKLSLKDFVLVGHSMGGLVGLLYLEKYGGARGFINVEGNLNADDCFFSREVIKYSYEDFVKHGFEQIKDMVASKKNKGFQMYQVGLARTLPRAYFNYCPSMTEYSTHGNLVQRFIVLFGLKMFVYGSENNKLAYLDELRRGRIEVVEIPNSNHWPGYDNPEVYYGIVADFARRVFGG